MMFFDASGVESEASVATGPKRHFSFLLLPSFSPMDVNMAIEALWEANAAGATPCYTWSIHTETGEPLPSRSGVSISVSGDFNDLPHDASLVICGGNRIDDNISQVWTQTLRRAVRHGAYVGALGSGCAVLLSAGILTGKKAATHWAISTAMKESFPDVDICQQVFEKSNYVTTCAGGLATVDMFLDLIATDHGLDLAQQTAAALTCSNVRDQNTDQTFSLSCLVGSKSEALVAAVQLMKDNIEHPMTPTEIADEVGVSCRQMERMFAKYLGMSPKRYSDKLRLEHARELLMQTRLTVLEVAVACGFVSAAHFSKLYRKRFGIPPSAERGIPVGRMMPTQGHSQAA
jgi:transcriptional regulator GlxA family with amidase domain